MTKEWNESRTGITGRNEIYNTYVCGICGITGKKYGLCGKNGIYGVHVCDICGVTRQRIEKK